MYVKKWNLLVNHGHLDGLLIMDLNGYIKVDIGNRDKLSHGKIFLKFGKTREDGYTNGNSNSNNHNHSRNHNHSHSHSNNRP